jgi:TonB family protein
MMLLKASDLGTFKVGEQPKVRVRANFSFHRPDAQEVKGIYVRELESAEKWRNELQFGDLRSTRVRNGNQVWTHENFDFMPIAVEELLHALFTSTFRMAAADVVKRVHDRKINGIDTRCVEFESIVGKTMENGQICVQKDTGLVTEWQYGKRITTYSDYSSFAGRMKPRHITIEFESNNTVVADVSYDEVTAFDSETFKPLADGEVSDVCTTSRGPIAKYAPNPVYPLTVPSGAYKGKVVVDIKVGPDGHVQNAAIAETVQPQVDAAALEAVKKWQYEPGTCNGKPIKFTIQVSVNFQ